MTRRPRRMLVAGLLVSLLGPSWAWALTPAQAQSLPVDELARIVLGEVGRTVIAVDRPAWPTRCSGPLCPPVDPAIALQRDRPPPLENGMTFHRRPVPTLGGLRPVWLCSSTAIEVFYGSDGNVGELRLSHRYGLSSPAHRRTRSDGERNLGEEKAACAKTTRIEHYFRADDDGSAYQAGLASLFVAELMEKSQPLPFPLACHVIPGGTSPNCSQAKDARAVAARLDIRDFFAVRQLPCARAEEAGTVQEKTTCYEITLNAWSESFIVEMNDSIEKPRIVRLDYSKGLSVS